MKYELIYHIVKKIYCDALREEVHKLAKDSSSKVDDIIVGILDRIFGCEEK
jgi:hypothetical protein